MGTVRVLGMVALLGLCACATVTVRKIGPDGEPTGPSGNPVLLPVETIRRMDAVLDLSDPDHPGRPEWPEAFAVVGNPPFLGGKMLRRNLGSEYVDALFSAWEGRVPKEADLCCYWFEKAREMVERGRAKRVGLLATQGIRGGANREVLRRIKGTGDVFFAVSDRDWILDGANVHVSMVGFDDGSEKARELDGAAVASINADLTSEADLTAVRPLPENAGIAYMGDTKGGAFDIDEAVARGWLEAKNPHGRSNAEVLRPWVNGADVTGRPRSKWIIDCGTAMPLSEAACFEAPVEYLRREVKPERDKNRREAYREKWWIHVEPRPALRARLAPLRRYVATPNLTKHRLFVFLPVAVLPDHQLIVFARADDFFFGVLHSSVHERWSRRMGTQLREAASGCRYTPTTCFETFPFPPLAGGIAGNSLEVDEAARRERIARAAQRLVELRDGWLNPRNADGSPALAEAALRSRTLTNLYNERPTWLENVHLELDRAVLAAYGWPEAWAEGLQPKRDAAGKVNPVLGVAVPDVEREVLGRLLLLNRERVEDHTS